MNFLKNFSSFNSVYLVHASLIPSLIVKVFLLASAGRASPIEESVAGDDMIGGYRFPSFICKNKGLNTIRPTLSTMPVFPLMVVTGVFQFHCFVMWLLLSTQLTLHFASLDCFCIEFDMQQLVRLLYAKAHIVKIKYFF